MNKKIILSLSLLISVLIITTSSTGLFLPDFYKHITENRRIQTVSQDFVNLFIVAPLLIISAILVFNNKKIGHALWAGTVLYLLYTYVIYCFSVYFNKFFVEYVLILGTCFYLFLYFLYSVIKTSPGEIKMSRLFSFIGIYMLIIAVVFYALWLIEILPAIRKGNIPKSLSDAGLITNPVHVLDLSVILPGIFITGIMLLKKKYRARVLARVFLIFFVLMDITIALIMLLMKANGFEAEPVIIPVMVALALFSAVLFVLSLRKDP